MSRRNTFLATFVLLIDAFNEFCLVFSKDLQSHLLHQHHCNSLTFLSSVAAARNEYLQRKQEANHYKLRAEKQLVRLSSATPHNQVCFNADHLYSFVLIVFLIWKIFKSVLQFQKYGEHNIRKSLILMDQFRSRHWHFSDQYSGCDFLPLCL